MSVRPAHTTPGPFLKAANGSTLDQTYPARRWYETSSKYGAEPHCLYFATLDGCRSAYLAGVYARLFGVSLCPIG